MSMLVRLGSPIAIACSVLLIAGCGPSKSELAREIAELKDQVEKGSGESRSLTEQLSSAKAEIALARKQLAEAKTAADVDIELARKELAEAKTAAAAEQKVLGEARAELEKTQAVVGQRDRQVESHESEIKTVRAQLEASRVAAQSAAGERDTLATELAALRDRIAAADAKLQQTGLNLDQEQRRASDLTDRLAAAMKDQSSLKQMSEAQRAELASISAALADAQAKVAILTGARGIYTVQDGDSLSSIALYFYRNAHRWPGIAQANKHLINHPDRIFPAMVLIIPK